MAGGEQVVWSSPPPGSSEQCHVSSQRSALLCRIEVAGGEQGVWSGGQGEGGVVSSGEQCHVISSQAAFGIQTLIPVWTGMRPVSIVARVGEQLGCT